MTTVKTYTTKYYFTYDNNDRIRNFTSKANTLEGIVRAANIEAGKLGINEKITAEHISCNYGNGFYPIANKVA